MGINITNYPFGQSSQRTDQLKKFKLKTFSLFHSLLLDVDNLSPDSECFAIPLTTADCRGVYRINKSMFIIGIHQQQTHLIVMGKIQQPHKSLTKARQIIYKPWS